MYLSFDSRLCRLVIRKYLFLLYECLNDDDEEIRDKATNTTCRILDIWKPNLPRKASTNAIVTSVRLTAMFHEIPELAEISRKESIQRMVNGDLTADAIYPIARKIFEEAMADNTALFAVEKQNLYVDQVRESNTWAKVLKKQTPKGSYTKALEFWASEGLQNLCQAIESEADGALGWSSKPEMFVFAVQVLNTTDVLFNWLSRLGKYDEGGKIIGRLVRLDTVGSRNGLHEMILAKTGEVLDRAIVLRLQMLASGLKSVSVFLS